MSSDLANGYVNIWKKKYEEAKSEFSTKAVEVTVTRGQEKERSRLTGVVDKGKVQQRKKKFLLTLYIIKHCCNTLQ